MDDKVKPERELEGVWAKVTYSHSLREVIDHFHDALVDLLHLRKDDDRPLVQDDSVVDIVERFRNFFGKGGSEILGNMAVSEKLNGGKKEPGPHGYFVGQEYSFPAMLYAIDCAMQMAKHNFEKPLSDHKRKKFYKQFVSDVERSFKDSGADPGTDDGSIPMPNQARLEAITQECLEQLRTLGIENLKQAQEGPQLTE